MHDQPGRVRETRPRHRTRSAPARTCCGKYRDGEIAIYERNLDHWDPEYAGLDSIEIDYFPDAGTRLNALRAGQIDATPIDVSQIDEVKGGDEFNVDEYETIETYRFQPDRTKSEFGNPLVARR